MKCRFCEKEALSEKSICGDKWCVHKQIEAYRELREVAKNYPELAKAAGYELPERKSKEEALKELGF